MEIKNRNGNKIKDVLTMDIEKIPMEKIPKQNRKKTVQNENQIKNTFTMQMKNVTNVFAMKIQWKNSMKIKWKIFHNEI